MLFNIGFDGVVWLSPRLPAALVLCTALKLVGGFGKIIERVFRTRY